MVQTMYAHMNKWKKMLFPRFKKKKKKCDCFEESNASRHKASTSDKVKDPFSGYIFALLQRLWKQSIQSENKSSVKPVES
jgi:hypothetical protein